MQFINQLLQFLQQGLAAIFKFVQTVWGWSVRQIQEVPWDHLTSMPWYKVLLLLAVAAAIVYLLYKALKELLEAGEKALSAFATLLTVFVKTLPPVLMAGAAAAVGAWLINHVNL